MPEESAVRQRIEAAFPDLSAAIQALGERFFTEGRPLRLPSGEFICMEGQACSHLALVLDGSVRVYKSGESGRELTLYRVGRGDSCILTASCILNHRAFPAFAVTETEVEAFVIPAGVFNGWVEHHTSWQHYVFQLLSSRLERVIEVIEEVVFRRMDARLADYLLHRLGGGADRVDATHEAIAADLGTSREVVSRLLKDFERDDLVRLGRGTIALTDRDRLAARASS